MKMAFPCTKISDLLVSGWANFEIESDRIGEKFKKLQKLGLRSRNRNRYFWDEDSTGIQR